MTKQLYFRTVLKREHPIRKMFLKVFLEAASYPRLILEVFTRKDFGQRYFSPLSFFTITIVLFLMPFSMLLLIPNMNMAKYLAHFLTFYVFVFFLFKAGLKRWQEIKRNPSVFDFARYSLSSGTINPRLFNIKLPGLKTDTRLVETVIEPGLFLVGGIVLFLLGQYVGLMLILFSLVSSFSYFAAYMIGDDYVMDIIDQVITNEEMEKVFVADAGQEDSRGFEFKGRKPENPDLRRRMMPLMMDEEETVMAN